MHEKITLFLSLCLHSASMGNHCYLHCCSRAYPHLLFLHCEEDLPKKEEREEREERKGGHGHEEYERRGMVKNGGYCHPKPASVF